MQEIKVLVSHNLDEVLSFEVARLAAVQPDEAEREFTKWQASWRKESLEHYLPLGWSFGIWSNNELVGYFLAQPQLFTRGHTQTLWVEQVTGASATIITELKDIARRIAREKHFQKVVYKESEI